MKIGLIGQARDGIPDFGLCDEYYGLAWDEIYREFCTHLFEPHTGKEHYRPNYVENVNELEVPVYVNELGTFENEILLQPECNYLESSAAYMLDHAIENGASEIHIWGFKMEDESEYQYQKANFEYLVGYAIGTGVDVHIYNSSLCKYSQHFDNYPERYGVEK